MQAVFVLGGNADVIIELLLKFIIIQGIYDVVFVAGFVVSAITVYATCSLKLNNLCYCDMLFCVNCLEKGMLCLSLRLLVRKAMETFCYLLFIPSFYLAYTKAVINALPL